MVVEAESPRVQMSRTNQRQISVAIVISSLEFGGAERQVVELIKTFDRQRVDAFICSLSSEVPLADSLPDREKQLQIVQKRSKFDLSTVPRLAALLRQRKVDVIHAFLFDAEMVARLAAVLARVPVVIASERNSNYRRKPLHTICHHLTRPLYDGMIANSYAGKEFNIRTLKLPADRIDVVHNGVDVNRFQPDKDAGRALRQELGIPVDDFVVGIAASFKRQKRHEDFLRMSAEILKRHPNAWFIGAGEPLAGNQQGSDDYHREIQRLLGELGLTDRCRYLGARKDMQRVYNACDVTTLPSSREGVPNVLLESMACGVPVVATTISDNAQIVREGITGHLVPVGDVASLVNRVDGLLSDRETRLRMGEAARSWITGNFSLATVAQKTEAVYRRHLAAKGRL